MADNAGVNAAASLSLNVDTASSESRVDSLNAKLASLLLSLEKLSQNSGKVSISATVKADGIKEAIAEIKRQKVQLNLDTSGIDAALKPYTNLSVRVRLNMVGAQSQLQALSKQLVIPVNPVTQAGTATTGASAKIIADLQKQVVDLNKTLDTLTSKGQTVVTQASKDLINFSSTISGAAKRDTIKLEEAGKSVAVWANRLSEAKALVKEGIDLSQLQRMAKTTLLLGDNTESGVKKSIQFLTQLQQTLQQLPEGTNVRSTFLQKFGIDPAQVDIELSRLKQVQASKAATDALIANNKLIVDSERASTSSIAAEMRKQNQLRMATEAAQRKVEQARDVELYKERSAASKAAADALIANNKRIVDSERASTSSIAAEMRKQNQLRIDQASRWAELTQPAQLRAAIRSARTISAGEDPTRLRGAASFPQAIEVAQAAGGVAALEKQLVDISPAHARASESAKHHAAQLKALRDHAWDAHSAARGLAGGLNMLWLTYGATIPLMTGAALSGGFLAAAKAGSEFAYQLTFVKALGGETADTMRSISETTLTMSKGSMQGPLEMAQGLRILSQAGLDAQKSLQVLPSVLDLAVVGEMKMEQAAVTLTGVMNAFSLSVADIPRIGDVFAKAAAESQTSVVGMTEAMKTASVVGEQYGATLEDTATALTLLAKMNISGTAAGTSLRNMLKELYTPGAEAAKVMQTLGLKAFDAQGKMKDFPTIIYDMKERLKSFDRESQVNILQKLFGERGAKEAIAMISLTREKWDELNSSISNSSGFIRGVSAELEMTTKGRFLQAVSTFQANLIEAFNQAEGPMRDLADNFRMLADSAELREGLNAIVSGVASIANVLVSLTPALLDLGKAWVVWKGVSIAVGGLSALSTALGTAGASIGAFITARAALTGTAGIASVAALKAGLDGVAGAAATAGGSAALGGFATTLARMIGPLGLAVTAIGALAAAYVALDRDMPKSVQATDTFISALDRQIAKINQENAALREQIRLKRIAIGGGDDNLDALQREKNKVKADLDAAVKARRDGPLIEKLMQQFADIRSKEQALISGQTDTVQANLTLTIAELTAAANTLDAANARSGKALTTSKLRSELDFTQSNLTGFTLPVHQTKQIEYLRSLLTDAQLGEAGSNKFTLPKNAQIADGYRAQIAELKNFTQQYEAKYQDFIELSKNLTLSGQWSETEAIQAATDARIFYYEREIAAQQKIVAHAGANLKVKGAAKDVQDAESAIAVLNTKIDTAVLEGRNKLLQWSNETAQLLAKAWAVAGKQTVDEVTVQQEQFLAQNQKLVLMARQGNLEALSAIDAALTAIDNKVTFTKLSESFDDSLATIQARVAEIEEEISSSGGGWIQRWIGGEEIFAIVQSNIDALTAKIEELKRQASEMPEGSEDRTKSEKQIAQYQKQLTTLKKSTGKVWADVIQNIDKTFHDGFVRMLEGGKDGWEAWAKSLNNTFKSIVADSIYQMFARPFVLNLVGNVAGMVGANGLDAAATQAAGNQFSLSSLSGFSKTPLTNAFTSFAQSNLGQSLGLSTYNVSDVGPTAPVLESLGESFQAGAKFLDSYGGYINAAYQLSQGRYGSAIGSALGTATGNPILAVVGNYVGGMLDDAFGSKGAPKSMTGGGARYDMGTVKLDPTGLKDWTNYTKIDQGVSKAIFTDSLTAALKRVNASYSGSAFAKGEINVKGSSSNQVLAAAQNAAGEAIYSVFRETGKGFEDYKKFLEEQIPKLQLAVLVDAMRTAGTDMQSIADSVIGTTGDLTQAIDQLDSAGVTNTIKNLENLGFVFKSIKNSIDDSITGEAVGRIAKFATSISSLAENLAGYEQNYLSNAERASNQFKELKAVFDSLNLAMPTSKAGFRYLVESLDETSDGGAKAFAALMDIQGAFATWADVMNEGSVSAKDAADNLRKAYKDQETELTNTIKKFTEYSKSLKDFRVSLLTGNLSPLDTRGRYAEAKSQFEVTKAKALLGDETAVEALESVSNTFLELSREMFASGDAYTQDFNAVIEAVEGTESLAVRHLRIADSQLNTLKDQVEALITINDNVISLKDALSQFTLSTLQEADRGAVSFNTIKSMYSDILGREAEASGLAYWQEQSGNMSGSELLRAFLTSATQSGNTDAVSARAWAKKMGIPGFASGGFHSGGIRMVGESGVEIEATGPARYWDATKTREFLTRGTTADGSTAELQQIKAELKLLREEQARQTGDLIRSNFAANRQVADKIEPAINREPARFSA